MGDEALDGMVGGVISIAVAELRVIGEAVVVLDLGEEGKCFLS